MLGTLIFAGLGLVKISVDSGEFSNMGASLGPPQLKLSREVLMGLTGRLDPVSRIIFLLSRFLSMNDWTRSDCFNFLSFRCFLASRVSNLDSPCSSHLLLLRLLRSFDISLLFLLLE